jgi:hypothetical protein
MIRAFSVTLNFCGGILICCYDTCYDCFLYQQLQKIDIIKLIFFFLNYHRHDFQFQWWSRSKQLSLVHFSFTLYNKTKNKYHNVRILPKSDWKIIETELSKLTCKNERPLFLQTYPFATYFLITLCFHDKNSAFYKFSPIFLL